MTWVRFDDRMPFHRKWIGLSPEAFAMGVKALIWARSPEAAARPGFVTLDVLRSLSGGISRKRFQRAVDDLVTAGAPAHERGILVPADGGFEIHDFADYGPPGVATAPPQAGPPGPRKHDRSEAARIAGQRSAQVRRERNGTAQPPRTASNVFPNVPERPPNAERSNEQGQPAELTPDLPDPDPEPTTTTIQGTEPVRLERRSEPNVVVAVHGERKRELTEIPPDLYERAKNSGVLQLLAYELDLPIWDVEAAAREFQDYWTIGAGMRGLKRDWMGELRQRIVSRHRDGRVRGMGEPPGADEHREHASPARERRTGSSAPARPFVLPLPPPSDMTAEEQARAADAARAELDAALRKTVAAGAAPKRAAGGAE